MPNYSVIIRPKLEFVFTCRAESEGLIREFLNNSANLHQLRKVLSVTPESTVPRHIGDSAIVTEVDGFYTLIMCAITPAQEPLNEIQGSYNIGMPQPFVLDTSLSSEASARVLQFRSQTTVQRVIDPLSPTFTSGLPAIPSPLNEDDYTLLYNSAEILESQPVSNRLIEDRDNG